MLGLSRMAVSRLVTRGELRAVYFPEGSDDPEQPDYVGAAVGQDDPLWLKLVASISDWDKTYSFPKAVYVSFGDVVRLWKQGSAKEKCKRELQEIVAAMGSGKERIGKLAAFQADKKRQAEEERKKERE
ncbi:MAG: hypothetical protein O3C40_32295 [Planctomycetota bacterium]|nr:hypothetical protein [Planctomycetota bacterium]